jgi:hypothetical protein
LHFPLFQDNSKTQCTICLKFITIKSLSKHMAAFHKDLLKSSSSSSSSSSILSNDNNNILVNNRPNTSSSSSSSFAATSSSKSGKGGGGRAAALEEKTHPCRYCKKAFVSAAKLRLHVAKCHAEERHKSESLNMAALTHLEENIQRHYFATGAVVDTTQQGDFQLRVLGRDEPRFPSPDSLPSQQVPELDLPYNAHSSPEDQHGGGSGTDLNSSALSTSSSSSGSGMSTAAAKEQLLQVARRLTSSQDDDDDEHEDNNDLEGGGFSIPTIHIPEFPDTGGGMRTGGLCAAEISNEAIHALFFN